MAILLNIDTATEVASVCVSLNGSSLAFKENKYQREHASFVHAAIEVILNEAGLQLKDMNAFAVTSGPGSYTGLRVAMATAKGFCYAFSKPLVAVNTLEVMAEAAVETIGEAGKNTLLCPMIDARRMEVFAAMFDSELNNVFPPQPVVLNENSFSNYLNNKKVIFFGSGSNKFSQINTNENAIFKYIEHNSKQLACLAEKAFEQKKFADVSYSEPTYLKDFHSFLPVKLS